MARPGDAVGGSPSRSWTRGLSGPYTCTLCWAQPGPGQHRQRAGSPNARMQSKRYGQDQGRPDVTPEAASGYTGGCQHVQWCAVHRRAVSEPMARSHYHYQALALDTVHTAEGVVLTMKQTMTKAGNL